MPEKKITAADLIHIGQHLQILRWPENQNVGIYGSTLTELPNCLESVGFPAALNAIRELQGKRLWHYPNTGRIAPGQVASIESAAHVVGSVLMDEARQKQVMLTDAELPEKLTGLADELDLSEDQQTYRNDVETCVRCRLYRPAVIVAWTLCYDRVRLWAFRDPGRLTEFNRLLANRAGRTYCDNGGNPYQVAEYEDFHRFKLGESFVLQILRDGRDGLSVFNDRHYRALHHLDRRNKLAHASDRKASRAQAHAYVEDVIDLMVSDPFV